MAMIMHACVVSLPSGLQEEAAMRGKTSQQLKRMRQKEKKNEQADEEVKEEGEPVVKRRKRGGRNQNNRMGRFKPDYGQTEVRDFLSFSLLRGIDCGFR